MNKFKEIRAFEYNARKEGITNFEYAVWWLMRLALLVVLALAIKESVEDGEFSIRIVQIAGCTLATFTVPLVRHLFFFVKTFRRITYRTQTWLTVTCFLTSFFGQGLDFYHEIPTWDKYMHLFSGGLVVLIGNELVQTFARKGDRISPFNRMMAASGFSYFVIVIWELYEFTMDYFWEESALQRFEPGDSEDHLGTLFVKIFGESVNNNRIDEDGLLVTNWQLFDTNIDMLYAFLCCILFSAGLFIFYTVKEKKAGRVAAEEEKETVNV